MSHLLEYLFKVTCPHNPHTMARAPFPHFPAPFRAFPAPFLRMVIVQRIRIRHFLNTVDSEFSFHPEGIKPIVSETFARFRRPVNFDDRVVVGVRPRAHAAPPPTHTNDRFRSFCRLTLHDLLFPH